MSTAEMVEAPPDSAMIRPHLGVTAVSKRFPGLARNPDVHALGPVDLALQQGEFFALVGPSGCGKSTLLDIIAGLTAPSAGEVVFEGRPVAGSPPDGLGVVLQEDASYPWLSGCAGHACRRRRLRNASIARWPSWG